jgi:hypothetical protein
MDAPQQYFVQEWHNQTTLHPVGLVAVIVLGLAMLVVPRRSAVLPMLIMAAFIAPAQRLVVFSFDFNLLRVMVLCGWLRILLRHEGEGFRWKKLDTAVLVWAITYCAVFVVQYMTLDAVINRLGWAYDALGMYFLFRMLVRSLDDLQAVAGHLLLISLPVLMAFLIEKSTGRNLFSFLGGVPQLTVVREGRLRCQGAFPHSILAGTFWAAAAPLIAALFWGGSSRRMLALAGVFASTCIVLLTASSTPLGAVMAALVGGLAFCMRGKMRLVNWGIALSLFGLHMVMQKPVWHLLARVDFAGGSTGYHRYKLIDSAIRNFNEWWLLGTKRTAHWGYMMYDVCNEYVQQGVRGGIISLVLFIAVLTVAFKQVGRLRQSVEGHVPSLALSWALGVSLFVHVISFLGVSYFGQIIMLWYLTLAMIGSLAPEEGAVPTSLRRESRAPIEEAPAPPRRVSTRQRLY